MARLSSREKILSGVVVGLVVVLAVVSTIAFMPNALAPKRSTTVHLYIYYYGVSYQETVEYSVFYDGHHTQDNVVTGNWTGNQAGDSDVYFVAKWSGDETHQCLIEVYIGGDRYTESLWLLDGVECYAKLTLNE